MLDEVVETKVWALEITIGETRTRHKHSALLRIGEIEIAGSGLARRNPHDPARLRIGEELAVAWAPSDPSHQLLDAAASDIEAFEGCAGHLEV